MGPLQDDSLQMFFNEDFIPSNYVDALYSSIAGTSNNYSPQTLSKIITKNQDLIAHLEYNTNEVLHELEKKIEQLKRSSSHIGAIELNSSHRDMSESDTTRLQYYVDTLRNCVESLKNDSEMVRKELSAERKKIQSSDNKESDNGNSIDSLILLKEVKANILKVCQVLQAARKTTGSQSEAAVSEDHFQESLEVLQDSIKNRWKEANAEQRQNLSDSVKEFRSWVPLFQPFTKFGPIFSRFVVKLETEFKS